MNFKLETIVEIFRKIIKLNAVIMLKSINEYYRKHSSKSGLKMDLYPAMLVNLFFCDMKDESISALYALCWEGDHRGSDKMQNRTSKTERVCKESLLTWRPAFQRILMTVANQLPFHLIGSSWLGLQTIP